jgi:hypothetical protein
MLRTTLLALLLALLAFAAACGDDDGGTATPTNTSGGESLTATEINGETASPESDSKTPGSSESPGETSPAATAPGDVPTPGPTAPGGTPAVAPADESAFLAQFAGQSFDQQDCAYNPASALTNCGANGLYSIDPPIVGQDTQCSILFFSNVPRVIQCHTIDAGGNAVTRNYEIQQ